MPRPLSKKQKLEMMAAESRITGDRISGLPKPVLLRIFSFVDMKQAVQISVLGATWRRLWVSLPVLNFDFKLWKKKNLERFVYFVNRVLVHEKSKIEKICFSCSTFPRAGYYHSWVSAAVERGVEGIDLDIIGNEMLNLPQSMVTSGTRVLKLGRFDANLMQPPISFCSSAYLKTLELVNVGFPEGDSNGEMNISCEVLESLIITDCGFDDVKIFCVSAPLLENLVMEDHDSASCSCELKICSRKLKSLKWTGSMFKDYYFDNLSDLLRAEIDFDTYKEYLYLGSKHDYYERKKVLDLRIVKVLKGLRNAKALTISERSLEALADSPVMLELLSNDSLLMPKYLKLQMNSSAKRSYYRNFGLREANLLKCFGALETLRIETDEVQQPEFLFQYASDHLKFVEIQNLKGCESELRFLKFLLENAAALEKITITTSDVQLKGLGGGKNIERDFCRKLLNFPKASSSVSVDAPVNSSKIL